jgi:Glycogen synthase
MPPSPAPLKVLFATSEIYPLVKTGGLADVSASLPEALRTLGADVRVLLPGYPLVMKGLPTKWVAATGVFEFGEVRILSSVLPSGVPALVVDYPPLFQRDGGPYLDRHGHDWHDNAFRFGLLSRVAAILAGGQSPLDWRPDVLHCNDWQAGLAPAHLHYQPAPRAATVMTLHNLAYQGIFPLDTALKLGLPPESMGMEGVEYYGEMSFLKAGLHYSDAITTVSPTYAREIQTDALGFGLQGLLQQRREALSGILNGIDVRAWNPETDPHLAPPSASSTSMARPKTSACSRRGWASRPTPGYRSWR